MTQEPDTKPKWNIKPKSPLDDFVKERGEDIDIREDTEDAFYKRDILTVSVSYIGCVKLDNIEIPKTWSEKRREDIKKWATPDELCSTEHDLPEIEYNHYSYYQEKYNIVDGIHRINRAKELGKVCIRAKVTERVKVDKTDTNNIELKQITK